MTIPLPKSLLHPTVDILPDIEPIIIPKRDINMIIHTLPTYTLPYTTLKIKFILLELIIAPFPQALLHSAPITMTANHLPIIPFFSIAPHTLANHRALSKRVMYLELLQYFSADPILINKLTVLPFYMQSKGVDT